MRGCVPRSTVSAARGIPCCPPAPQTAPLGRDLPNVPRYDSPDAAPPPPRSGAAAGYARRTHQNSRHRHTRAAGRRSPVRQDQGCKSPAACGASADSPRLSNLLSKEQRGLIWNPVSPIHSPRASPAQPTRLLPASFWKSPSWACIHTPSRAPALLALL